MIKDKKQQVFVCGGGHQGLSMAAHLALNDIAVTLWNRTQDNIKEIVSTNQIICSGVVQGQALIEKASSNMEEVVSDFIMVTTPSTAHKSIAKELAPFVHKDMVIVLNPGRTFGAIEFAETLLEYGVKELPHIAETQTIVYTCRRDIGNKAQIFALKDRVKIAAIKGSDIGYIMDKMPECLKPHFQVVDSILETSLENVGVVLHCAPVLMNVGWIETDKVDFKYYYDGISPSVAKFIEKIDEERVNIAKEMGLDVDSTVAWMNKTYNIDGNSIYECIRKNMAYKEIDAPSTIHTRYIFEDIPNGLVPMEYLANNIGLDIPQITLLINYACAIFDRDFREMGRTFSMDTIERYI